MRIMSFNVLSKDTWGKYDEKQWEYWKTIFNAIIKSNHVDIIALQEVYNYANRFSDLCNSMGTDWAYCVTYSNTNNCKANLQNMIIYNTKIVTKPEDISPTDDELQNYYKNTQVFKFADKNIILVNTHFRSDCNRRIIKDTPHEKDLRNLCKLLNTIENRYPDFYILSAGDLNYSNNLLSEYFYENSFLTGWLLDDELNLTVEEYKYGCQTTLSGNCNCMDHFIYNEKLRKKIKKNPYNNVKNDPWNWVLGVIHEEQVDKKPIIKINETTKLSWYEYLKRISDHFPIVTELII